MLWVPHPTPARFQLVLSFAYNSGSGFVPLSFFPDTLATLPPRPLPPHAGPRRSLRGSRTLFRDVDATSVTCRWRRDPSRGCGLHCRDMPLRLVGLRRVAVFRGWPGANEGGRGFCVDSRFVTDYMAQGE